MHGIAGQIFLNDTRASFSRVVINELTGGGHRARCKSFDIRLLDSMKMDENWFDWQSMESFVSLIATLVKTQSSLPPRVLRIQQLFGSTFRCPFVPCLLSMKIPNRSEEINGATIRREKLIKKKGYDAIHRDEKSIT